LERAARIELARKAWEAFRLPLHHARNWNEHSEIYSRLKRAQAGKRYQYTGKPITDRR